MPKDIDMVENLAALLETIEDKTLLIMDDDGPLRMRMSRALESRGFQVKTAQGVHEALAIVRESPPAFAVLDMRLEDGSGPVSYTHLDVYKRQGMICRLQHAFRRLQHLHGLILFLPLHYHPKGF